MRSVTVWPSSENLEDSSEFLEEGAPRAKRARDARCRYFHPAKRVRVKRGDHLFEERDLLETIRATLRVLPCEKEHAGDGPDHSESEGRSSALGSHGFDTK